MHLSTGSVLEFVLFIAVAGCAGSASQTRILFGSCNDARSAQPLWQRILSRQPDVWIWGGDNIYADRLEPFRLLHGKGAFRPADETYLRSLYQMQLREPGYAQLRNSSASIVGTWDDHDYGVNDGDKHFPGKSWSQAAFLDFLQEPLDSPRRAQRGVYTSHHFTFLGGSVLVVLLDMRFNRDAYGTIDGDFLGEAQWSWLQQTLAASTASIHIFVSSMQLLPVVLASGGENWRRFPKARERFLRLLIQQNVSAPVVLSGDVHFAQISKASCTGGSLLEVQSSGMTHSWGTGPPNINNMFIAKALHMLMLLFQWIFPYRYQFRDPVSGKMQVELGLNFAELEINWQDDILTVRIFGEQAEAKLQQHFHLAELNKPAQPHSTLNLSPPPCVPEGFYEASPVIERLTTYGVFAIFSFILLAPCCVVTKLLLLLRTTWKDKLA